MYISEMNKRGESGVVWVEARVTFEKVDKPPFTLFIETDPQFQEALWADPNAFLIGCVLPAWRIGERRVKVEGSLCPVLCHNISVALATLKSWYPKQLGPAPEIEPSRGFRAFSPRHQEAVSLLSCGIDSLATLRWNKLHLPSDHPASIKGTILIAHDNYPEPSAEELNKHTGGRLVVASEIAADAGVDPIPVRTNIWWLVNDGYFYDEKWLGAVLSSIACYFSRRFHKAYIASGRVLGPYGSHPMLDPYYSSAHFQIEHHGTHMSRLEKTALVAEWHTGLHNIRVCQNNNSGTSNCGTCGKCIETMTALVALDKLKECRSFPADDVSPELLNTVNEHDMIHSEYQAMYYWELVPMLERRDRHDLVTVIQQFLRGYSQKPS